MEIQTNVREDILEFALSGMIDASNYLKLEEAVQSHIQGDCKRILFNLEKLEYMSSAGIRVFIKVFRSIKEREGEMVFCSLQPFVMEIFEMAGLTSGFQIFPDLESAIQSFSSS